MKIGKRGQGVVPTGLPTAPPRGLSALSCLQQRLREGQTAFVAIFGRAVVSPLGSIQRWPLDTRQFLLLRAMRQSTGGEEPAPLFMTLEESRRLRGKASVLSPLIWNDPALPVRCPVGCRPG